MSLETQTTGVITFGVFRLDVAKGELKRLASHSFTARHRRSFRSIRESNESDAFALQPGPF